VPLTSKGEEILANMKKEYGAEKGEEVFHASKNAGKITGVDETKPGEKPRDSEQPGSPYPQFKAGDAAELESALPASLSHSDLAARSREIWERGAGRPAPTGVYGDSKKPSDGKPVR